MQKGPVFQPAARYLAAVLTTLTFLFLIFPGALIANEKEGLSDLWIDLSLGPPLIELFNEKARVGDIARVEHISQLELLEDVTTGKKLVVFKSAEDAIRLLPHIHDEIDIIGYNLEHGPANPMIEQENPLEYMERLREAADEYDLEVALGPDRAFALSHASQLAPYADYVILQIQKVQTEPETVYDFVLPVLRGVRLANPDIQTSVQIRTEGDVDELLALLEALQDEINGISILTSEETTEITEELMGELRAVPVQPTPTPIEKETPNDVQEAHGASLFNSDNPITATIVARSGSDDAAREEASHDDTSEIIAEINEEINETAKEAVNETVDEEIDESSVDKPLSAPESNQRNGSTWLFIVIALIVGFALGAGYVSYRASS